MSQHVNRIDIRADTFLSDVNSEGQRHDRHYRNKPVMPILFHDTNATKEGRDQNRRVTLVVLE